MLPYELRSPYDVINLGYMFGLSEEQSNRSIVKTARSLILHAVGRRSGNCVAIVTNAANAKWSAPSCLLDSSSEDEDDDEEADDTDDDDEGGESESGDGDDD